MPLLEVRDLTVSIQRGKNVTPIVQELSFDVDRRQTLGIVGESGSGKSLAMLCIMGLLPASTHFIVTGSVKLGGQELTTMTEEQLQSIRGRQMAMVYQDPMVSLNPVMRTGNQIDEGMIAHGLSSNAAKKRTLELLGEVGIPDPARLRESYPHELSGGMRQRVMIASALAMSPELLIFDEPTTALDVTVQSQILYLVSELQKNTGIAVIWITHDLGVLASLVDRVAVMYGGRLLELDDTLSVFRKPQHPYTQALIASVPDRFDHSRPPLQQIPGSPPDFNRMPTGCPFQARCSFVLDRCRESMPPLNSRGTGSVACWMLQEDRP